MKSVWLVPLLLLFIQTGFVHASDATMVIKKFELKTCSSDRQKCMQLQALEAQSGQFTPIMILKDFELTIVSQTDGKTQRLTGLKGYVDLDLNRFVFKGAAGSEVLFDLNTFNTEVFKL